MTITLELQPEEIAKLTEQAQAQGVDVATMMRRLIGQAASAKSVMSEAQTIADPANTASIALLESWLAEDATDDPAEIDKVEAEMEEFKQGINAARAEAGARLIYP